MRSRLVLLRLADRIDHTLERRFKLCAAVLVLLLLAAAIAGDIRNKLWNDELLTLFVARQSSFLEIVKATLQGCDGAPPLYAMLVHALLPWVRPEALAVRLPATFGYCGMLLCLLAFCRRRLPAVYSLLAVLLVCAGSASLKYATEGRGYGLVLCCAAGALLCWQAAADGRRRIFTLPLLALCLALMTSLHYYAMFFGIALLPAEIARWRRSGKFDWPVLAAMLPVLAVLALHYPLIAASKQAQQHFWSPATWGSIAGTYSAYLKMGIPLVALGLLVEFFTIPEGQGVNRTRFTLPEWLAAGAFFLLPFFIVVLSIYTTHVFVDRYTLWAIPGIAVLLAGLLSVAARGLSAIGVGTLALLVILIAFRETHALFQRPVLRHAEAIRQELQSLPDGSEPIVVANHHAFMELSYYAAPRIRERLIDPVSSELDLHYRGYDTDALLFSALASRSQLHIDSYAAVLAAYPRFVLAALPDDYLPWHLVKAGYRVVPIDSSKLPLLYAVQAAGN